MTAAQVCHFCDAGDEDGRRLFTGTRTPPAYICEDCVTLLGDIVRNELPPNTSKPPPALWEPFEYGGEELEWWAMRVTVPKKGARLMVCVRRQGDDGDGAGNLYPASTSPSLALAEETASKLAALL